MPDDEDIDRQSKRLRILAECSHVFAEATLDATRLLQVVASHCCNLVGDGCYIRLIGSDGVTLEPVATFHPDAETERYLRQTTDTIQLRVGEGISGKVVETGEPVLIPVVPFEAYRKMTKPEFVPIFEKVGITSLIVVRLRARAVNLGFLALVRNGPGRPYTEDDLHLVADLGERAALAIDTARLLADLERRVALRTRDLEAANQELEAFSYSVSHDLRAPLRAIDGFSEILEEDHAALLDESGRRVIAVIRKNVEKMNRLIEDLLRFSRLGRQAIHRVEVSMRTLVEGVVEELRASEPSRTIDFQVGPLPDATCDHALVRQVWCNLLDNAVKYTRGRAVALIQVQGAVKGDEIVFEVTDNGTGFDPDYADKLFVVFQRLHGASEFEGNGVGLALVARIVERHGGRVWASSRLGEGATFGFSLPYRRVG